ncbi:MAG: CBS domain-containing protein [Planctomycetota bacterium]
MKVAELMVGEVRTCRPENSLLDAARLMWEGNCGCVPVVDEAGRPVGMLTDRDLAMSAFLRGRALHEIPAGDVMTRDVHCCQASDSIEAVQTVMRTHQVRRVPVVTDQGTLAGLVSLGDIARASGDVPGAGERRRLADEFLATCRAFRRARPVAGDTLRPAPPLTRSRLWGRRLRVR